MSPSTNPPERAFRRPDPGTWTCLVCRPVVHDKGGQREFYSHWNRTHLVTKKGKPWPP